MAYYRETVNDSPYEIFRIRPVEIFYYLEDDSIMVQEPGVQVRYGIQAYITHSCEVVNKKSFDLK